MSAKRFVYTERKRHVQNLDVAFFRNPSKLLVFLSLLRTHFFSDFINLIIHFYFYLISKLLNFSHKFFRFFLPETKKLMIIFNDTEVKQNLP